ncbi:MAG: 2-oxoacid:acceptor oxidoreductase family protein [Spirochaetota bacterium]|jgi:2-oxoisovalerate ferredoxin oxidoreductase beta subunit|nr:2-oxoacid:acceptor oxidoreductase family protein [Spirochaetota bacterium]
MKQAEKSIQKPKSMYARFERKPGEDKTNTHYCPGCGHGIVHKLIAEALDTLDMAERTVFISPVGCSVFAYYYFDCGNIQVAHGRAPAVASGVTRANPGNFLISYQGDGDLAAIGTAEIIHAANRGEKMTVFFVNNSIYGMTGGQMAPTTLLGQKTTTTPFGREFMNEGNPIRIAEMIAILDAPVYVARASVHNIKAIMQARKSITKALQAQRDGKGFALVEILAPCPSGWKIDPQESAAWVEKNVLPVFPLGEFKDETVGREGISRARNAASDEQIISLLGLDTAPPHFALSNPKAASLRVLCAGFGGQGIMLLGQMLAHLGMRHGLEVSWLPSYGPEMRGGTANCSVVFSEEAVGSPIVEYPDLLVIMNGPSLDKFLPALVPGGVLVYNSSIIENAPRREDVQIVAVPASDLALQAGSERAANIVMFGVIVSVYGSFSEEAYSHLLAEFFTSEKILGINEKALRAGMEYARNI